MSAPASIEKKKKTMARNPPEHAIDPADRWVGDKVRTRRKSLGISQHALAETCGITFQQVQKYEKGSNRISASMLVRIAKTLDVRPGYFLDDVPGVPTAEPEDDSWAQARRIVAAKEGTLKAILALGEMSTEARGHAIAVLQIMAGMSPNEAAE